MFINTTNSVSTVNPFFPSPLLSRLCQTFSGDSAKDVTIQLYEFRRRDNNDRSVSSKLDLFYFVSALKLSVYVRLGFCQ